MAFRGQQDRIIAPFEEGGLLAVRSRVVKIPKFPSTG